MVNKAGSNNFARRRPRQSGKDTALKVTIISRCTRPAAHIPGLLACSDATVYYPPCVGVTLGQHRAAHEGALPANTTDGGRQTMALLAMAIPILPGKTDQWRRF